MRRWLRLIGSACVLNGAMAAQVTTPCRTGAQPIKHTDFPEIRDFKSLRMNLTGPAVWHMSAVQH